MKHHLITLIATASILISSCKKSENFTNTSGSLAQIANSIPADITNITSTSALFNANILSDQGSAITAKGVCWSINQNPTINDNKTSNRKAPGSSGEIIVTTTSTIFTANITGLLPNTTYYARVYATNSAGTSYGNQISFKTVSSACDSTVTDIDGNVYHAITIGTQCWLLENLRVSRYRNGDSIPTVVDNNGWFTLATGAQCYYGMNAAVIPIAGRLYNWYAATDSRGIAPAGWHIPSDSDWTVLSDYLGGISVAGGKLKQAGTTYWMTPNTGATNSSGFTALPAGFRYDNGPYSDLNLSADWFSSTSTSAVGAMCYYINFNGEDLGRTERLKRNGFSLRCVRD